MASQNRRSADTTIAPVGRVDDLDVGEMRLARVGDRRIVLARTESGIFALDNNCPHQGYGLVTGSLAGDRITCQWHNWKFCVADGTCEVGEENVASHPVEIRGDEVWVSVTEPTVAERREHLWPSLDRGIAADFRGQIARDVARLLDADADPADIVWAGVRIGAPRAYQGVGHETAAAADCLASVELYEGLARTLPLAQALAGISETTRDRPPYQPSPPDPSVDFADAVEREDRDGAVAALMAALADDLDPGLVRQWFIESVARHHLDYGHGAIYTQKAFELLERAGWDRAADLLPHLVTSIVYATREDTLPYMRKAMRAIAAVDLDAVAAAPGRGESGWADEPDLRRLLLEAEQPPIGAAVEAVLGGAGVAGLLDAVSLATAERLVRYDHSVENDLGTDFGWLDITHGLTYARAARWAWDHHPSPAAARLALFTVFLCYDTGRLERRTAVGPPMELGSPDGDLTPAIVDGRVADAMAVAAAGDIDDIGNELRRAALLDGAGSFIVVAHLVKMAQAAWEEARVTGSNLPLVATARLAAAPRRERFVARNVAEAVEFVRTGSPPIR